MELLERLIETSLGPPGAAYGILGACDSLIVGRPVPRTQMVSFGVIYRAWTDMRVLESLLPSWMPFVTVYKPPGGVSRA